MAARVQQRLGKYSRLSRRAKHLIRILRKTRVHSVRMQIMRELMHELQRGKKTSQRMKEHVRAVAQKMVTRAGSHLHIRGGYHCIACDRSFHNRLHWNAHQQWHLREARTPPAREEHHTRNGARPVSAHARNHARDHLVGAGLRTPDGRLTEHARTRPQGAVRGIKDLKVRARHDRNAAKARLLEEKARKAHTRGRVEQAKTLHARATALRASRKVVTDRKLSTRRRTEPPAQPADREGHRPVRAPQLAKVPSNGTKPAPSRTNGARPAPAPRTAPSTVHPPKVTPPRPGTPRVPQTPPMPADTIRVPRPASGRTPRLLRPGRSH